MNKRTFKILHKWQQWLLDKIHNNNWAAGLILFFTFVYILYGYLAYTHFQFTVYDLGLFNRHFWGMAHGNFGPNPLKGYNLLADHAHFSLILLTPIYFFFQSPLTLVSFQALAIGVSGLPIYLIAKKHFSNNEAALWLLPYYLFFGIWSAIGYPFHEVAVATPLIAAALYFLLEKKYRPLIGCLFVLMLTKEDQPLFVIMIGLYMILLQKEYWLGSLIIVVNAIYFGLIMKVWFPRVSPVHYRYTDTGLTYQNPLQYTGQMMREFFLPAPKTESMLRMLGSFAFLPLIGLEILVLLLPLWAGRFLSPEAFRWAAYDHYSVTQAPVLAVAAIIGAARLRPLLKNKTLKKWWPVTAVVLCLICYVVIEKGIKPRYITAFARPSFYYSSPTVRSAQTAVNLVPHNASVGVQSAFPQLTSREKAYSLPMDLTRTQPDYLILSDKLDYYQFTTAEDVVTYAREAVLNHHYQYVINSNGVMLLKYTP